MRAEKWFPGGGRSIGDRSPPTTPFPEGGLVDLLLRACTEHSQTELVRPGASLNDPGDVIKPTCVRGARAREIDQATRLLNL